MKKLLFLLAAVVAVAFTGCSKNDGNEPGGDPTVKPLAIEVRTGETYTFDAAIGQVLTAPNAFYAETTQNGIKGLRDGKTSARVIVAGTTYDCTINVKAKNTLYLDPMTLLGVDKNSILALYGDPVANEGESYLFGPPGRIRPRERHHFQF